MSQCVSINLALSKKDFSKRIGYTDINLLILLSE